MSPTWARKYRTAVKINKEDQVMWSLTKQSLKEIGNRFKNNKGYLYWDQYIGNQPNLMIAAECTLKQVSDPFSSKVLKWKKCPTGQ